jgi:hypothetical protein
MPDYYDPTTTYLLLQGLMRRSRHDARIYRCDSRACTATFRLRLERYKAKTVTEAQAMVQQPAARLLIRDRTCAGNGRCASSTA